MHNNRTASFVSPPAAGIRRTLFVNFKDTCISGVDICGIGMSLTENNQNVCQQWKKGKIAGTVVSRMCRMPWSSFVLFGGKNRRKAAFLSGGLSSAFSFHFHPPLNTIKLALCYLIKSLGDIIMGYTTPESRKSLSPVNKMSAFASIAALKIGRSFASRICCSETFSSSGIGTSSNVTNAVARNLSSAANLFGNF